MKKFKLTAATNKIGSDCDTEFWVDDSATPEQIEEEAKASLGDVLEWWYEEVKEI